MPASKRRTSTGDSPDLSSNHGPGQDAGVRRLAPALLLLFGCKEAPPPAPPDGGLVIREDLNLPWQAGLPRLPVTSTVPPSWVSAVGQWKTATAAFSIGAYDDSSRAFLAAADALGAVTPDEGVTRTMQAGRCMAFENAARAFEGSSDPEGGIVTLVRARVRDQGCRSSLTRAIDRLSSTTVTGTTAGGGDGRSR